MNDIFRFIQIYKEEGLLEALARTVDYIRSNLASRLREREWMHLQAQEALLNDLFEGRFTLILLDACRYDYFERNYPTYLKGNLTPVRSSASWTGDWLEVIFGRFKEQLTNVKIFSATPYINSKGIPVGRFNAKSYIRKGKIIDIWDWGWDSKLGTVHPDTVVEAVREEGLEDKNIIWFMQPHLPYIGETKLLVPRDVINGKIIASRWLAKKIRTNEISKEYLFRAYEDNLKLVLKAVERLIKDVEVKGRCVITSDHGELLGESGAYLHPSYLNFPEQRIVPWLDINC